MLIYRDWTYCLWWLFGANFHDWLCGVHFTWLAMWCWFTKLGSIYLFCSVMLTSVGWLCVADVTRMALWCWFTEIAHITLSCSVVLILLGWLCGADFTRLYGADIANMAFAVLIMVSTALWCWFNHTSCLFTKTCPIQLVASLFVVLISLGCPCVDFIRPTLLSWFYQYGSVVLIQIDWLCGAGVGSSRPTLWCWFYLTTSVGLILLDWLHGADFTIKMGSLVLIVLHCKNHRWNQSGSWHWWWSFLWLKQSGKLYQWILYFCCFNTGKQIAFCH